MDDDRPAKHEDAGLHRDVGQGYPEEAPAGTNPDGLAEDKRFDDDRRNDADDDDR